MSQRREFIALATVADANIRQLSRRFGISPATAYKWIGRFEKGGLKALENLSRRPHHSPCQTAPDIEQRIVEVRLAHPTWGGRKIRAYLKAKGLTELPAVSTITGVLHRHNLIDPEEACKHAPFVRFERPMPNDLWQMDFKGDFPTSQGRCHPLTVLDDHSRFNVVLRACGNQQGQTIRPHLVEAFRRYGLPRQMLCDNGPPWGSSRGGLTVMAAWLIRLGIEVHHGRPFHPQTQGKDERFHRTLKADVVAGRCFADLAGAQAAFDPWREVYNHDRPHEALNMNTPASRYQPSNRSYPETLPPIEYGPDNQVRKADHQGYISFHGRRIHVSEGVANQPVGLRPTEIDGAWEVYYCHQKLDRLDLRDHSVNDNGC